MEVECFGAMLMLFGLCKAGSFIELVSVQM